MNRVNIKHTLAFAALLGASVGASALDVNNGYVFGDSLSDNGNLRAFAGDPSLPERFTNGAVAVEITAAQAGWVLTPSLHLIPGMPHGNNYATATATAIDEDGDEATVDLNLPSQVNAFLQYNGFTAPTDALYSFIIGTGDVESSIKMRLAGMLADTREERRALIVAAKDNLKAAVASEEAQIRKLIAAGAQHILVSNIVDYGALPVVDLFAEQALAQATTAKQAKRIARLQKVATRLSVKYNKLLAKKIAKIEKETGIDIIEFDLFSSFANQLDHAEELGFANIDTPCIYTLDGFVVNPECTDFPIATGFLFWDQYHTTGASHSLVGNDAFNLIKSH